MGAMTRRSLQDHPGVPSSSWDQDDDDLTGLRESTKTSNKTSSTSIEINIFSNIIQGHDKTSLNTRQVEDHVEHFFARLNLNRLVFVQKGDHSISIWNLSGLTRRIPPICILFSAFFQEDVN